MKKPPSTPTTTITIATIKEVRHLFDFQISASTASRKIQLVRDALNKPHPQIITMKEFRAYFGI